MKLGIFKATELILLVHLNTCKKFELLMPHRSCVSIVLASVVVWLRLNKKEQEGKKENDKEKNKTKARRTKR